MSISRKNPVQQILESADIKIDNGRAGDIVVNDPVFFQRVLTGGSLALGESYMDGDWDCNNLDEFFYKVTRAGLQKRKVTGKLFWEIAKTALVNPQSVARSRKVAELHYNLGNDLYSSMLGRTMQYTCAYWTLGNTLDDAQTAKMDLVARKLHLSPGMKVLELGSGFGTLAKHLAEKYNVEVNAFNISHEQVKFARENTNGLPVHFHEEDYRNASGKFDRVISVGLMEHIGPKNYRDFMKVIDRNLIDGGLALVHTIGRSTSSTIPVDPWIRKYIFPGGHLPSLTRIAESTEGLFDVEDVHNLGINYDRTLMAWHNNFNNHWSKLKPKYGKMQDEKFKRMQDYYLLSCAGAFRSRSIQLWQTVLSKGREEVYQSQR